MFCKYVLFTMDSEFFFVEFVNFKKHVYIIILLYLNYDKDVNKSFFRFYKYIILVLNKKIYFFEICLSIENCFNNKS